MLSAATSRHLSYRHAQNHLQQTMDYDVNDNIGGGVGEGGSDSGCHDTREVCIVTPLLVMVPGTVGGHGSGIACGTIMITLTSGDAPL